MNQQAVQAWLEKKVQERADVESAVVLMASDAGLEPAARWPGDIPRDRPLAIAAETAFSAKQAVTGTDPESGLQLVSHPILSKGQVIGACALRLLTLPPAKPQIHVEPVANTAKRIHMGSGPEPLTQGLQPQGLGTLLRAENALSGLGASSGSSNPASGSIGHWPAKLLKSALEQSNAKQAATVVATDLAQLAKCERVSLGFVQRKSVKVSAISHGMDLKRHQMLFKSIRAVMDEAVDQAAVIHFPQQNGESPRITLAAAKHAEQELIGVILCVPIVRSQQIVGAILCERKGLVPFSTEQIDTIGEIASSVCSVLDLKRTGEIGSLQRLYMRLIGRRVGGDRTRIKLRWMASGIAFCAAVLAFVPVQHKITSPARLEAKVQRTIAAPIDGFIKQVRVRPGDIVKQDQPLVELVDDDLLLEKRRLDAEVSRHEQAYAEALARQDRAQMIGLQGKVGEARAQLTLVEQQLQRLVITAPFDAIVIKGDIKEQVGAPVKRGEAMMTISPSQDFRVVLEVEERDVSRIKPEQRGQLAVAALIQETFALTIDRVLPIATTNQGRAFFEVEARIMGAAPLLRPGMEGVARVQGDERSLGWVLGHRFFDWARLTLWSLGG